MIKDKILIFSFFELNINSGGPSGFLAHNLYGCKSKNWILSRDIEEYTKNTNLIIKLCNKMHYKFYKLVNKEINDSNIKILISKIYAYCLENKLYKFKYIYFNSCLELYACRKLLQINHIVILQSHSPELPSEELKDLNYENNDVLLMQEIEIYAFNRANYIIFPNNDCVELYKKVLNKNCTIEYILSGCKKSDDVREYPIDKNFINILYIGRRNRIKGFDIVLREFEKAYKQRKDIRLIIAGNGSKIEQDGVVDIGFTTTPLNWFKSVDFVINANRQSYFDLSVLEVLSVGTPLILALNWGHKFFKNKSKGILTYEKPETELYEILMNLKFKNEHKESMIEDNLRLYNHLFTDTLYRERLEKLLLKIKTNI